VSTHPTVPGEDPAPVAGPAAPTPEDPTPPEGVPTPPTEAPTAPTVAAEDAPVVATPRRLRAVPDEPYPTVVTGVRTGAFGRPIGKHRPTALHRLVEAARVLTGGLMVLTVVVVVAPLVLAASGPGVAVLAGHVAGAVVALVATGLAAWRRTPVWAATVAALVVPLDVLVVLTIFWWR
jgi:hypothetical protein